MNFQDNNPSIPYDNFKNHYVLVFHLTSMQYATENCHYTELVELPMRLELNFTFPPEHITDIVVMAERTFSVGVDKFAVVRKII